MRGRVRERPRALRANPRGWMRLKGRPRPDMERCALKGTMGGGAYGQATGAEEAREALPGKGKQGPPKTIPETFLPCEGGGGGHSKRCFWRRLGGRDDRQDVRRGIVDGTTPRESPPAFSGVGLGALYRVFLVSSLALRPRLLAPAQHPASALFRYPRLFAFSRRLPPPGRGYLPWAGG